MAVESCFDRIRRMIKLTIYIIVFPDFAIYLHRVNIGATSLFGFVPSVRIKPPVLVDLEVSDGVAIVDISKVVAARDPVLCIQNAREAQAERADYCDGERETGQSLSASGLLPSQVTSLALA